jgi:hypothetical protein
MHSGMGIIKINDSMPDAAVYIALMRYRGMITNDVWEDARYYPTTAECGVRLTDCVSLIQLVLPAVGGVRRKVRLQFTPALLRLTSCCHDN